MTNASLSTHADLQNGGCGARDSLLRTTVTTAARPALWRHSLYPYSVLRTPSCIHHPTMPTFGSVMELDG